MNPSVHFLLLLCLSQAFCQTAKATPFHTSDPFLFELATGLTLIEQYQASETCYGHLAQSGPPTLNLYLNRGSNFLMWGMSLLSENDAENLVKYIFPVQVAPDPMHKGTNEDRFEFLKSLIRQAANQFQQASQLDPAHASAALNRASAYAVLGRLENRQDLIDSAFMSVQQAEQLAAPGSLTRGYALIVKGILYEYLGNSARRQSLFNRAERQFPVQAAPKVHSLLQRNQAVMNGGQPVYMARAGSTYDFLDPPEEIDFVSLQEMALQGFTIHDTLGHFWEAPMPYQHARKVSLFAQYLPGSTGYLYWRDASSFLLLHRTGVSYTGTSGKGVRIGATEGEVRQRYGSPLREQAAIDGKFLYYKDHRILFYLDKMGRVAQWTLWFVKKS